MEESIFWSLVNSVTLDQNLKINIFHMVVSEHLEVVEGRQWLIATNNIDPEDAAEDFSIDDDDGDA